MEIAGYSYTFDRMLLEGALRTVDTIRYHRELGVTANELSDKYIEDAELSGIEAALAEVDGTVPAYDITCDFTAGDGSAPPDQIARVERAVDRAARLRASAVVLVPGAIGDADPAIVRRHYAATLAHCRDRAIARGMRTMLANLGNQAAYCGTIAHIAQIRAIAGADIQAIYDVGNYLMAGEDTLTALGRVAPMVGHVHFKDWRIVAGDSAEAGAAFRGQDGRLFLSVALGDGSVPLADALGALRRHGYDGTITVEYEGPDDPFAATRRSVQHLRSLLGWTPL